MYAALLSLIFGTIILIFYENVNFLFARLCIVYVLASIIIMYQSFTPFAGQAIIEGLAISCVFYLL